MSAETMKERAVDLLADTLDLIKQVLVKHETAVLEEFKVALAARTAENGQLVERSNARFAELEASLTAAQAEIAALTERLKSEGRDAVKKYGDHLHNCNSRKKQRYMGDWFECDCGFDAAIDASKG